MRSSNAFKNLLSYFVYEALVFAAGLIFPRFIIMLYGSEINGLTSTISRALSLVNLIQAGAVGAAIYQMYKPVAENDFETQSAILYSSRRYYNKITILYIFASIVLGIVYGFYLKNDSISFFEIFLSFITLGISGAFPLFLTTICDIYVSPHQKAYFLKISSFVNVFVHYGLLTIVLLLKLHFLYIYLAILGGNFANALLNYIFYRRLSKGKITKNPINKNFKIPNRGYLMLSSVGTELVTTSPSLVITTIVGLAFSSVFSVYSMVFSSMRKILVSIQYSVSPIFGNVVKTSDDQKTKEVYDFIEFVTIMVGTIVSACVGFLIIPFIHVYTLNVVDMNYMYPVLAFLVVAYVFLITVRTSFNFVATVYGLFKQMCIVTIVFGITGVLLSIGCVFFFGFPYVMCGLLFYELACIILTLYFLKKNVSWFSIKKLIIRSSFMLGLTLISVFSYLLFDWRIDSILKWIIFALIVALLSIIIVAVYSLIFERKQLKLLFNYIHHFFKKKKG